MPGWLLLTAPTRPDGVSPLLKEPLISWSVGDPRARESQPLLFIVLPFLGLCSKVKFNLVGGVPHDAGDHQHRAVNDSLLYVSRLTVPVSAFVYTGQEL